jgi:hypothetical protein
MIDTLKTYLLAALAVICLLLGVALWLQHGRAAVAIGERDLARQQLDSLGNSVKAQKELAAVQLRTANASVLARQRALEEARAHQENTDATNLDVVRTLRADLGRLREQAERARRGNGGAAQRGGDPRGAFAGAGGGAQARGLFPAPPAGAAEEDADAYDADILNLAYASCRADALKVRAALSR